MRRQAANITLESPGYGNGVPQDYAQAFAWWRKAADKGNADAQNNLGWMYVRGRGVGCSSDNRTHRH
jgi:TPR repeat protein